MAKRIFIVDDIPDFLELMEDVLSEAGYEVHAFTLPSEAAAEARDSRLDLIITDLRVGEESGFDLLRTLLQDPSTASIPMLVCTAATMDVEEHSRPLGVGNIPVIYKPFEMRHLLERVRELLDTTPTP